MPRKCSSIFNGEPCRTNYSATKKYPFEGGTVYGFPTSDPSEQELWEKSLPKRLSDEGKGPDGKIKKTIGVCYKHFPPDCPKKKQPGGSLVPTVLPSIFGCTDSSLFLQTTPKTL